MRRFVLLIAPFVGAATGALLNGCGLYEAWFGPDAGVYGDCDDPNDPAYNDIGCIESRCRRDADVPTDDCGAPPTSESSSSSSSGSSARCSGTCTRNAPDYWVGPEIVYIGPPKWKYLVDSLGPQNEPCPQGAGSFGSRQWTDLYVPPPGCPACVCGPIDGSCTPPKEIRVRSNVCDVQPAASLDFSGPDAWDGLCTNVNAVPAGVECPPGSGIPCAQSIVAPPLAPPTESCKPVPLPIAKATNDAPAWKNMVLSCNANATNESCEDATATKCMPPLPTEEPGWRYCVRHQDQGAIACPPSSEYSENHLAYDSFIDTRRCTECECKASGGSCQGTLRVYKDDSCNTNELVAEGITSEIALCSNLMTPGEAIGSKELTDLTYVQGKCEPTGGEPIGTVIKEETNNKGQTTVTTWCCLPINNAQ